MALVYGIHPLAHASPSPSFIRIISSTSEGRASKTSARISLAVSSLLVPGFYDMPPYAGPLSAPPGLFNEMVSKVIWPAISSEMILLLPQTNPLHIIEAEDLVGKLGHGFKVPV
jgi:hypothetical protein